MKASTMKGMFIPLFITWICLFFLIPNNVLAQNKPENVKKFRTERAVRANQIKKELRLSEDQKTKIKDLRIDHAKAIQLLKAESAELTAHLKTLNLAENPNNKAIFKTIDEMMANRGEMMKRMVSFKQAFKAILTPEQIKEMEARHFNNRNGMGGKNQRFNQRGRSNFGPGQMMQRDMMNRQGQMQRGQMMNRQGQGFGGNQMSPQMRMQHRMQMIHKEQPKTPDTTTVK
jgi:Spy/CpxP family protein refolding chaperone